ncbi:hypothetical protein [Fodinicurvata sp. EGI_FJ10296]|uniref:DUF2243 domain-containing protein n=1 Tax=Fodinicurvata sp. EGI_FJ10296 TaxID=3231908 RepID=UPI0034558454
MIGLGGFQFFDHIVNHKILRPHQTRIGPWIMRTGRYSRRCKAVFNPTSRRR